MRVYRSASEEETIALGERIARELPPRGVVLLIGELGAGKTTLAKGIVKGLGAGEHDEVSSPTFTLIHEYGRVYHIDLYRIEDEAQLRTLGLDELMERDGVLLIEWGERFPRLWPADRIEIELDAHNGEREIRVRGELVGRASARAGLQSRRRRAGLKPRLKPGAG